LLLRGLLDDRPQAPRLRNIPSAEPADPEPDAKAVALWRSADPINETLGERYLRARGITLELPLGIRFLPHAEYMRRLHFPALAAAVQGPDRRVIAVQLTYLDPNGRGKAQVQTQRKTIGALGRGAVRLGAASDVLGISEGLETGLAATQLHGVQTWVCLGAARMAIVSIAANVRHVVIFADCDGPGHDAAIRAAERFKLAANVSVRFPREGYGDWNDVLLAREAA
jgi:hypothetical protein